MINEKDISTSFEKKVQNARVSGPNENKGRSKSPEKEKAEGPP
jgi:hypothetical protein